LATAAGSLGVGFIIDAEAAIHGGQRGSLVGLPARMNGGDIYLGDLWHADDQCLEANLTGADLSEVNLQYANLLGATLDSSTLERANLFGVNLVVANLSDANLSQANLSAATLSRACMSNAKLINAILTDTNLSGAELRNADLTGTKLGATVFSDTNLESTLGLELCKHFGPSTLDHRTLIKSGPLPLTFLRGVGLPDLLIDLAPALRGDPLQFHACFLSYSSQDQAFAERLYADLQNKGVRCWYAPEDLKIGERIRHGIDEAIRVHDKLLLILSEHSVASQWVEQEVQRALGQERKTGKTIIFPIRIDDAVMAIDGGWAEYIRNTRNIGDMRVEGPQCLSTGLRAPAARPPG
jgi:uncharacterized protein YjbI with pentapeptide repeats